MTSRRMTPLIAGRSQAWSNPNWRWTSGSAVRKPAPSAGPAHMPVPPTMAYSRASSARENPNWPAEMKRA